MIGFVVLAYQSNTDETRGTKLMARSSLCPNVGKKKAERKKLGICVPFDVANNSLPGSRVLEKQIDLATMFMRSFRSVHLSFSIQTLRERKEYLQTLRHVGLYAIWLVRAGAYAGC